MIDLLIQDPQANAPKFAPPPEIDAYGQLPKLASTFHDVDGLFYFTYVVCIFFFVLITGVLLYSVVAHRRKTWDMPAHSNVTHNTPLEVVWTVIPLIIVMVMFAWGFKGSLDMTTVPQDAKQNTYKATAKQWSWTFTYPDQSESYGEVWVQVDKPVHFALESVDVLHAFYLPSMRVKRDVVPGRYNSVWFVPKFTHEFAPGEPKDEVFHLFCAEYCGDDHSRMYARLHVVDAETFAKQPWNVWDDSTPEAAAKSGAKLYTSAGCNSCHSVNGTAGTGPSWAGPNSLFTKDAAGQIVGRPREVIEGGQRKTITPDEAYIIESVHLPDAKKVVGFEKANMTPFPNLDERKIKMLIEYMKSLAQ